MSILPPRSSVARARALSLSLSLCLSLSAQVASRMPHVRCRGRCAFWWCRVPPLSFTSYISPTLIKFIVLSVFWDIFPRKKREKSAAHPHIGSAEEVVMGPPPTPRAFSLTLPCACHASMHIPRYPGAVELPGYQRSRRALYSILDLGLILTGLRLTRDVNSRAPRHMLFSAMVFVAMLIAASSAMLWPTVVTVTVL